MDFNAWWAIIEHWPNDWILIGAITTFLALDAMRSGSARATSIALGLPTALFLVNTLPQSAFIGNLISKNPSPVIEAIIFLVISASLYIAIHYGIFLFSDGGQIIQSLVVGLATAVILTIVWLQVPALESIWNFGPQVREIFGPLYRFWWIAAAFLGLTIARS